MAIEPSSGKRRIPTEDALRWRRERDEARAEVERLRTVNALHWRAMREAQAEVERWERIGMERNQMIVDERAEVERLRLWRDEAMRDVQALKAENERLWTLLRKVATIDVLRSDGLDG